MKGTDEQALNVAFAKYTVVLNLRIKEKLLETFTISATGVILQCAGSD